MKQLLIVFVATIIVIGFASSTEDNLIDSFYRSGPESAPRFVNPAKMENAIKVVSTGGSVRLDCRAKGTPEPRVAWFKNDQPLKSSLFNRENGGSDRKYTLLLTDLVRNDSGEYTCVVSNRLGSVQWTYTVEVHERPQPMPTIICPYVNVTVTEGENVNITCEIYSHLAAFVRWIKHYHVNGSYFDRDGAPYAKLVKDAAHLEVTDPYRLTLTNVTVADSGYYSILASTLLGLSRKTIEVIVLPRPFPNL